MASYVYTASGSANASANIATDKVRIATTSSPIHFTTSFPNVALTGTITCATNTAEVTGSGTTFITELNIGAWIGNTAGNTAGIVASIHSNTSLTLTANAAVAISGATARYNPFGVPYTIATANSEIIPSNSTERTIIVGQGNIVSYLNVSGATAAPFSITELGMPHANTGTSGIIIPATITLTTTTTSTTTTTTTTAAPTTTTTTTAAPTTTTTTAAPSDRRLKRNITFLETRNDINIYSFQYLWSDEYFVGVMAQDLLGTKYESAVIEHNGYYTVDYSKLGFGMQLLSEYNAISV
jgi:hypothetical protein